MGTSWSQFFPPEPSITEDNIPDQSGRVFLVTGGSSGVGFELCKFLYRAGAKVYVGARSKENAENAIERISASATSEHGHLEPFAAALDDLNSIKPAVEAFLASNHRLDALFNNAGISNPPPGTQSVQGHDITIATNCLAPYLLTQLLLPILESTAENSQLSSTRVVWTSSITVDLGPSPPEDITKPNSGAQTNYAVSKMGNWFLASALQKQCPTILSVTLNPGNLQTSLTRHMPSWVPILVSPLLYEARYGAYTNLWAGLSKTLTIQKNGGAYILPWGRVHPQPRKDMVDAMKNQEEGGTGIANEFVAFCERETREFR